MRTVGSEDCGLVRGEWSVRDSCFSVHVNVPYFKMLNLKVLGKKCGITKGHMFQESSSYIPVTTEHLGPGL